MCRLSDGMQMVTEDEKRSPGRNLAFTVHDYFFFPMIFTHHLKRWHLSSRAMKWRLHNRIELKLEIILALNVEKGFKTLSRVDCCKLLTWGYFIMCPRLLEVPTRLEPIFYFVYLSSAIASLISILPSMARRYRFMTIGESCSGSHSHRNRKI